MNPPPHSDYLNYQSLLKTSSQLYKRKAKVIFVILTYKYGFKFLPQFPSSSGGFLSIIIMYADRGTTFCSIQFHTVNQKVCSSHQIKRESLATMMRTPHCLGNHYELILTLMLNYSKLHFTLILVTHINIFFPKRDWCNPRSHQTTKILVNSLI